MAAKSEFDLLQDLRITAVRGKDSTTGATNTIDYAHHEAHGGRAFVANYTAEVDTGGVVRMRLQTPNTARWSHLLMGASTSLQARGIFIENTSLLHNASNAITPVNRNRNSSNVSGMTVCHTPDSGGSSSSSGETLEVTLEDQSWGTQGKGASAGFGGSARGTSEFVLAPNTAYLIEIVALADANVISITADWYEHTDRG